MDIMKQKTYMVLVADRKRARMFTLSDGAVDHYEEFVNEYVPQKVKHGDNTWDSQSKIFRHIEEHLHRHLKQIALKVSGYMKNKNIQFIIIGGHKTLLAKIKKHLPIHIQKMVLGTFVTALNIPITTIAQHSKKVVEELERQKTLGELEKSLAP
jgi:hypothetical protein